MDAQFAGIGYEVWRGAVVVASAVLTGVIIRIYMERLGRLPPRFTKDGGNPRLALINIGGVLYIAIDTIRNFGNESLDIFETPLASLVLIGGAWLLTKNFGGRPITVDVSNTHEDQHRD